MNADYDGPSVEQVRAFESQMQAIEGVAAAGVGEDETGPYFFVDALHCAQEFIPAEFEGYPVRAAYASSYKAIREVSRAPLHAELPSDLVEAFEEAMYVHPQVSMATTFHHVSGEPYLVVMVDEDIDLGLDEGDVFRGHPVRKLVGRIVPQSTQLGETT